MPEEGVSDLRDVFDAINKLCDDMSTSACDADEEDAPLAPVVEFVKLEPVAIEDIQYAECTDVELANPDEVSVQRVEASSAERWSDSMSQVSVPDAEPETFTSDPELAAPPSEMYYTASSEISLISDLEAADRLHEMEESTERQEVVVLGHVAAMRERFESLTRAGTPCPDLEPAPPDPAG